MRLYDTACPSAGAVRAVKLQDPSEAAVLARCCEHGTVFLHGRLAERLPDLEDPPDIVRQISGEQPVEVILPELFHRDALGGEPAFQLLQAVRVLQGCDRPGFLLQPFAVLFVKANYLLYHRKIYTNPAVVHPLIKAPQLLLALRKQVALQLVTDCHLRDHVLPIVLYVELPLVGIVLREVSGPPAVGLCGLARLREILDQGLTDRILQLVFRKSQGNAGIRQRSRQPALERHDHRI